MNDWRPTLDWKYRLYSFNIDNHYNQYGAAILELQLIFKMRDRILIWK